MKHIMEKKLSLPNFNFKCSQWWTDHSHAGSHWCRFSCVLSWAGKRWPNRRCSASGKMPNLMPGRISSFVLGLWKHVHLRLLEELHYNYVPILLWLSRGRKKIWGALTELPFTRATSLWFKSGGINSWPAKSVTAWLTAKRHCCGQAASVYLAAGGLLRGKQTKHKDIMFTSMRNRRHPGDMLASSTGDPWNLDTIRTIRTTNPACMSLQRLLSGWDEFTHTCCLSTSYDPMLSVTSHVFFWPWQGMSLIMLHYYEGEKKKKLSAKILSRL